MPSLRDQISAELGLPVVAQIPLAADGTAPSPPDEAFLEGVRFLRAELQTLGLVKPAIIVVPAVPSDAALEVARYLSRSVAESGRRALTILAMDPRELRQVTSLPGNADLPREVFARPEEVDETLAQESDRDVAIIYCPPSTTALAQIDSTTTSILLAEQGNSVQEIRSAITACDAGGAPPVAAAVLGRPRKDGFMSLLQRLLPSV